MPQRFGSRGFGSNWGFEHLGGGLVYVISQPGENEPIYPSVNGGFLDITIGVQGSIVQLDSVRIFINSFLVFDGAAQGGPAWTVRYVALSSYSYVPEHNGYRFLIKESPRFGLLNMDVTVQASTPDGEQAEHVYRVFLFPQFKGEYPPVPFGRSLGHVPLRRFTGEDNSGLLSKSAGLAFFSPSLKIEESAGADVDFDRVQVVTDAQDRYVAPQSSNARVFLIGPWSATPEDRVFPPHFTPGHVPKLNNGLFRLMKNKSADVVGTLTDTLTSEVTKILL